MTVLRTAHISHRGGLDVSRMTGDVVFAPSWDLLRPQLDLRRRGLEDEAAWQRYVDAYVEEMRSSWRRYRRRWLEVVAVPETTLKCYCVRRWLPRCHRVVLAGLLVKVGAAVGTNVQYLGEVA